ncbi:hypothetical protein AMELA_G00270670, partial [Ameiurus melas]
MGIFSLRVFFSPIPDARFGFYFILCIFISPIYPLGMNLMMFIFQILTVLPLNQSDVSGDVHIEYFNQNAYYKYSVLTVKQMCLNTPCLICAFMLHSTLH